MGKKKDKRKKEQREADDRAAAAAIAGGWAPPPEEDEDELDLPPYADGAVEADVVDGAFAGAPVEADDDPADVGDVHVAGGVDGVRVAPSLTAPAASAPTPATVAALEDAQVRLQRRPGGVLPGPPPGAPVSAAAREIVGRIAGATLCYGEPVRAGDRAVIPVARVNARGGMGFGGRSEDGGGGGGGVLKAAPAGFIEVTPTGTTYTPVPRSRTGGLAASAAVLAGAAAGVAGAALASRRRAAPTGLRGFAKRLGR
jgi:hypothetical protein